MKDFVTFFIGCMVLMPIVVCMFSGSFIGTIAGVAYLIVILLTSDLFRRFWSKWLAINLHYVKMIENLGKTWE